MRSGKCVRDGNSGDDRRQALFFAICFAMVEFQFCFSLASAYPGYCTNDSNDIIDQALGISVYDDAHRYSGLANHHPVMYTLLFRLVYRVIAVFGGELTLVVAVFLLLQCTVVACCCAWTLGVMRRLGVRGPYLVLAILFFAANPILALHGITMWKDVPFGALFMVFSVLLLQVAREKDLSMARLAQLSVVGLLLCFLRGNGIYIVLLCVIALAMSFKRQRRKVVAAGAALVLVCSFIQGPIFALFDIQKGHFAESISIPLQQVAAVVSAGGHITGEQRDFLAHLLPLDEMAQNYDGTCVNPVKFSPRFNDAFLESHKFEFFATWLGMMPGNVETYFKAWIQETYGYLQPAFQSWLGAETTLYEGNTMDLVGAGWDPLMAGRMLQDVFPNIFGYGSMTWCVLTAALFATWGKAGSRIRPLLFFVPSFGLIATLLIAAPTVHDFRYLLGLFYVLPILPLAVIQSWRDRGCGT